MAFQITGRIHTIGATQKVSERFTKRDLVLEVVDNPKYPQTIAFQFSGDRVKIPDDGFRPGDQVTIDFNLRGREWRSPQGEMKYFNTLDVWKMSRVGDHPNKPDTGSSRDDGPRPGDVDDIPF